MKVGLIIPAAGSGSRLGGQTAKQFLKLGREPVIVHTIKRFTAFPELKNIVVVLPEGNTRFLERFIKKYDWSLVSVTAGSQHRQDSVYNGFTCLDKTTDLVLVHDGVRPLVDETLIRRVINAAYRSGAAAPAVVVTDTLKKISSDGRVLTPPREQFFYIQTPQGFKFSLLSEALEKAKRDRFYGTDESYLVERLGYKVDLVPGSALNIKITHPTDLLLANAILKMGDRALGIRS